MRDCLRRAVAVGVAGIGIWAGLVGAGLGQTTQKRPMTFADLMAMKRVSDPQISPSGKWVLFSVTDVSLEKNTKVNHLWVVGLNATAGPSTAAGAGAPASAQDDKQKEKQVTFGDGETFGRFSPDGANVSFTSKDQIWIASWNEAEGKLGFGGLPLELKATDVAGGADGAIWSPDSKRLLFVADVYPECSDKATWAEENDCDKAKDDAADESPVKGQVWDTLLYRHWDHYTGAKRSHILMVERDPKARIVMDKGGVSGTLNTRVRDLTPRSVVGDAETPTWTLEGVQDYAWAPDSREIAYVTNLDPVPAASTNNDVFTLRIDEAGAKAVKVSTSPGSDDEPEYSPDGKWLAFRSQAQAGFESDKLRLMLFDREKKTIKDLMPKFDGWVDEFVWTPDSQRLYFASGREGEEMPDFIPVTGWSATVTDPEDEGEYSDLRITPGGQMMVGIRTTMDTPSEVAFMTIEDDRMVCTTEWCRDLDTVDLTLRSTTHMNRSILEGLQLAKMESFWFGGAEGTKVEGFILRPPGFDAAKKYPVKFLMHGGPQTAWGDGWSYRWNWELMAASGYVVVGINRRGSTGYGQKFVDEVSGDWGGRAYEDSMKGLDYAEAHYPFLDKTRECALGASYGGYMADWVLTHTNRFKCIVTHDGMYDPVSAYGTTEELWFNEWEFRRPEDFPKGWDGFSGGSGKATAEILTGGQNDGRGGVGHAAEPWRYQNLPADEDPFRRWSPMRFIENAKTPTLVIHSQKDYRLDVSQGFELYTALQLRGVPSKFLYFPDEGHWVLKPQNAELWNAVVSDWCDRWTKTGKYAGKQ
jgi:dipeptidyl aminopeptidase/acylaminoacyl peptidase